MKLLIAGDFYCFVLFYYWNILLLGCFFVAVDFSICVCYRKHLGPSYNP